MGLLWRPGVGSCPNLPQRRPGPGSVANETAEYQRFSSGVPARSGPLWQIWTTGAAAGPVGRASPASARSMTSTPARTPARRAVADRASAPFDRAGPARAPPGPRRRPNPRDRHLTHENVPLADDLAGYPAISRTATPAPDAPEGYSAGVCVHFQEAVSLISPEPAVRGPGRRGVGMNGRGVVLVGLLWRPGARSCPNLPQRRPRPGSVVSGGAEYQQFFSRTPARSGPLWQIWTIRRRGPAGEGVRGPGGGPGACLDDPAGPVDPRRTRGSAGPGQDPDARPDPRGPRPSPGPAGTPRPFANV